MGLTPHGRLIGRSSRDRGRLCLCPPEPSQGLQLKEEKTQLRLLQERGPPWPDKLSRRSWTTKVHQPDQYDGITGLFKFKRHRDRQMG